MSLPEPASHPNLAARNDVDRFVDKPGFLIRRAHQISVAGLDRRLQPYDLTVPQMVLLTALHFHPGVDQASLAASVSVDVVTVGRIVKRFVERGLVERVRSAVDGRAHELRLSGAGESLLQRIQPEIASSQNEILGNLGPEERQAFFTIMRKIVGLA
ncbi:Transcriptional regulator HosA [Pigmentiphaga humi]|uniref:Transcriptional regulator HosA n=1 Tax=Pigmentiphaga humi TaxID=2478468 RepID=A0A3P4B6G8_9BURK|nr:MarR family winged helix-turn-helix transcriptional regulator [Pigmentiphaga humi]VCU71190.1 Transcriptional regulator HosA [Pigmentiphaga humi]